MPPFRTIVGRYAIYFVAPPIKHLSVMHSAPKTVQAARSITKNARLRYRSRANGFNAQEQGLFTLRLGGYPV